DRRQRHDPCLGRIVGGGGRADAGGEGARGYSISPAVAATQVITPRRTRLVRVRDLHTFRSTISLLATRPLNPEPTQNPEPRTQNHERTQNPEPRTQNLGEVAIVVPTRGAATILQRSLGPVAATSAVVTRDELYDLLHARLANPPRRLSAL